MAIGSSRDSRWTSWAIALGLAALAVGVHLGVLGHELTNYDDSIDLNPALPWIPRGLAPDTIGWAFSSRDNANWMPLTRLSWLLDVSLFGFAPRSFFVGNLVYHALGTVLLFVALHGLTGALVRSALVAAIFAIHPVGVESVVWASERKDVLCGAAWMATLAAYAGWARGPSTRRWLWVLAFAACALLAKPMAVTLPFALLLLDVWPLQRIRLESLSAARASMVRPLREKLPLFAMVIASIGVTIVAQMGAEAVKDLERFPPPVRLANAALSYWSYLRKFVWPSGLAVIYPHPGTSVSYSAAGVAALGLVAATALALRASRQRPWIGVGWLWFVGTLVPVIGIVQVGWQAYADRYLYLPRVGLALVAVWGLTEIAERARVPRPLRVALVAGVGIALATTSALQVRHWRSAVTLFSHALEVTGDNKVAHHHLADDAVRRQDFERAAHHLRELLRIGPRFALDHANYASVLLRLGRTADALAEFRRAVEIEPLYESVRANAYRRLAESETPADVIAVSLDELRVDPESVEIRARLARAYAKDGRTVEAIEAYRATLQRQPAAPEIENNLAWILATAADPALRDPPEAVRLAESAVTRLQRQDAGSLDTLAVAYAAAGRPSEALAVAREALARAETEGSSEVVAGIRARIAELSRDSAGSRSATPARAN